jgi:hypothetical protein
MTIPALCSFERSPRCADCFKLLHKCRPRKRCAFPLLRFWPAAHRSLCSMPRFRLPFLPQNRAPQPLASHQPNLQWHPEPKAPTPRNGAAPCWFRLSQAPTSATSLGPGAAAWAAEQQNRFASRVQMSGSVPRGVRSSANGTFSATSAAPPSFNQLMRGNSGLRLNSNFGAQRFSSQNTFRPIGNFGDPGLPSASALFTSSDLGNGVFLSSGTGYGNHSTAGAPAASLGNGTSGGQKHSGASLALKLSF